MSATIGRILFICASLLILSYPDRVEARELKFSLFITENHPMMKEAVLPFKEEVERRTAGELTVRIYPSSVLGKAADQIHLLESGVADFSNIVPLYTKGRFPLTQAFELPFAFDTAIEGSRVANMMRDKYLSREYASVKLLGMMVTSPSAVVTQGQPIDSIDSLRGLILCTNGEAAADVLSKFGAELVSMPITDAYLAIDRGTIDGTDIPLGSMANYKFDEVVDYVNEMRLYSIATVWAMNKETWESLTPEQQEVVAEAGENLWMNAAKAQQASEQAARDNLDQQGIAVANLPEGDLAKLKNAAEPVWGAWAEQADKSELPGHEFLEDMASHREKVRGAD